MPTIAEVRAKYPQYDDLSDDALAGALHQKFYSDMPRDEFNRRIGYGDDATQPSPTGGAGVASSPVATTLPDGAKIAPGDSAEGRAAMLPFEIGADQGNAGAVRSIVDASQSNPLSWLNPIPTLVGGYLKGRGIEAAVPAAVTEPLEANMRGLTNSYAPGQEDQRARDALTVGLTGMSPLRAPNPVAAAEANPWRSAPRAAPEAPAPTVATPQQEALEAAARRGIEIPRGASDNFAVRSIAGTLKEIPGVGTPLVKAGRKAYGEIEGGVKGVADDLGGGSVEQAGGALRDDINAWVKTISKDEGDAIYAPVRKIIKNERAPVSRTGVLVREIDKEAAESFLDPPAALNKVRAAVAANEGLTYNGMSRLRSEIGQMLSGEIVPEGGMSMPTLKRLYGALSEDMAFLAKKAGGKKGEEAWRSANTQFRDKIAARRGALLKIVGKKGDATPAQVVDTLVTMAGSKRGADMSRLLLARQTAGKEAWDALGATIIERMGQSKDGWSLARFRTDYSKLNENAKSVLFSREHKAALDDYFKIGGPFEALEKLGNPSGSGRLGSIVAGGTAAITALPLLLKSAAGGYVLSRILAKPMAVKALGQYARAAENAAKSPTPGNLAAARQAERSLAVVLSELGIDPGELVRATAVGAASQQQ